jgi:hypothetical protein
VTFEVDPWRVLINNRPFQTYSKSERWRIAVAIQLAIAATSGLGFAMLDEVDILDADTRWKLLQMVLGPSLTDLTQIFVLGTREDDRVLPPARNGLLSMRLKSVGGWSGVVERVDASA